MADTKMSEKLWRDCKSDQERADFILCGRAHETGVIATSIQSEVAMAFQRLATLQSLTTINFQLPNHEPTIAIGEILDGYDDDDRDDVWESIKAYADVHARSALEATTPAYAAEAERMNTPTRTLQYDTKNSRVPTRNDVEDEQRNIMRRHPRTKELVIVNNENPPLDLQAEELVWTTYDGRWRQVQIESTYFGRSQTGVMYEVDAFAGKIDAAWFWREKPTGWEDL